MTHVCSGHDCGLLFSLKLFFECIILFLLIYALRHKKNITFHSDTGDGDSQTITELPGKFKRHWGETSGEDFKYRALLGLDGQMSTG